MIEKLLSTAEFIKWLDSDSTGFKMWQEKAYIHLDYSEWFKNATINYARFLSKPLTLEMFVSLSEENKNTF